MRKILQGTIAGILAGFVLGLLMKLVETVTDEKVYTLLMNVDYIPILKEFHFPERVEFSFHLIISILIAIILIFSTHYFNWTKKQILVVSISVNVFIAIVIYPTTLLSDRTPAFALNEAFLYWLIGHFIYGVVLGMILKNFKSRSHSEGIN